MFRVNQKVLVKFANRHRVGYVYDSPLGPVHGEGELAVPLVRVKVIGNRQPQWYPVDRVTADNGTAL